MCHANNKKRETTNDEKKRTKKSRKNQNTQRKENLQVLENIGSGHHQTSGDKRKRVSQGNEKAVISYITHINSLIYRIIYPSGDIFKHFI